MFGPFQEGKDQVEYVVVPVVGGYDIRSKVRRTNLQGKVVVFDNWVSGTYSTEEAALRMMRTL